MFQNPTPQETQDVATEALHILLQIPESHKLVSLPHNGRGTYIQ